MNTCKWALVNVILGFVVFKILLRTDLDSVNGSKTRMLKETNPVIVVGEWKRIYTIKFGNYNLDVACLFPNEKAVDSYLSNHYMVLVFSS